MKSLKFLFLSLISILFLVLFPLSVQAKDIEISKVEIMEKKHYVSEINSPSINEDKIDFNLKFEDYEQYIIYKITINNNAYNDFMYELELEDDSVIRYEVLDENNTINYSSTKDILLKVWYKDEINEDLYNDNKYNLEDHIKLVFKGTDNQESEIEKFKKIIENPETGAFFSIIGALVVVSASIIVFIKVKNKSKFKHFLWLLLLIPIITFASGSTVTIYLNFNIEIDKPTIAILEHSSQVNSKMVSLARGNANIVAVKRSFEKNDNSLEVQNRDNYSDPSSYSVVPSEYKIYMWYDETAKTIYYYSDAIRVLYHPSGSGFYNNLPNLQEIDDIKTDILYYASYMFNGSSTNLDSVSLDLSNWNMKNVASVTELLAHFGKDTKNIEITANDWEFNNIKDRNGSYIFSTLGEASEIGKVEKITINANNWKIGGNCYNPDFYEYNGQTYYDEFGAFYNVFYYVGTNANDVVINANNWNLENQLSLYEIFYGTGNDVYRNLELNVSGLNAPNAKTIQKAFISTAQDPVYGNDSRHLNVKIDVSNWNMPNVVDFREAFMQVAEYGIGKVELIGLETWDTSNVTNMEELFYYLGMEASEIDISGIENWNVSNVTNMTRILELFGTKADNIKLDLSKWDMSNVELISSMLYGFGKEAKNVDLNISGWKLDSVIPYGYIACDIGIGSDNLTFIANDIDLSEYENTNVFCGIGFKSKNMSFDLSNAKLPNYSGAIQSIGNETKYANIKLSDIDLSNNTTVPMSNIGQKVEKLDLDISNITISNKINTEYLMSKFLEESIEVNINASNWNLTNATSIKGLFRNAGAKKQKVKLDLSGWDTSRIVDMSHMFDNAFSNRFYTITYDRPYAPPTYHYYEGDVEPTIEIIGINEWNVSNVATMEYMFNNSFNFFKDFELDLSSWNISSLNNANYMFYNFGQNTTGDKGFKLNISGWNTDNITNKDGFIYNTGNGSSHVNIVTS